MFIPGHDHRKEELSTVACLALVVDQLRRVIRTTTDVASATSGIKVRPHIPFLSSEERSNDEA